MSTLIQRPPLPCRHQNPEGGFARDRITLDNSAVVADDLGDESKAEARAIGLRRDERIEQVGQAIRRHPGTRILYGEFERQRYPITHARHRKPNSRTEGGRQRNFARLVVSDRLGGILYEVEENLDQLITVG